MAGQASGIFMQEACFAYIMPRRLPFSQALDLAPMKFNHRWALAG